MVNKEFQAFADLLIESKDEAALRDALARIVAGLGFDRFTYVHAAPGTASPLVITTYPQAWAARYVACDYGRIDPVLAKTQSSVTSFEWGTDAFRAGLSEAQLAFLDEAAGHGIRYGYTVPIWSARGPLACLHLASSEPAAGAAKAVREQHVLLQLIGILFHSHVERKLLRIPESPEARLSSEEIACLRKAGLGAVGGDIRRGSPDEACAQVQSAMRKLGVATLAEALVRGLSKGYIQLR
jgi:LuxR family transcriptional activator of conjugal transfer of Ti plasmids